MSENPQTSHIFSKVKEKCHPTLGFLSVPHDRNSLVNIFVYINYKWTDIRMGKVAEGWKKSTDGVNCMFLFMDTYVCFYELSSPYKTIVKTSGRLTEFTLELGSQRRPSIN